MLIKLYEMHAMCKLNLLEILEKLKATGYKIKADLTPSGVKMELMNGNALMHFDLELYDIKDGYYIYEIKTDSKDVFLKLHDIVANI